MKNQTCVIAGSKGVFISTSIYKKSALDKANEEQNLVVIDGRKLAQLMYEYNKISKEIYLKEIDGNFFEKSSSITLSSPCADSFANW